MIEAVTIPDPVRLAGAAAGLTAAIGLVLLIPLFLSQYRDLRRLRAWHLLEPERGDEAAPVGPAGAGGAIGTAVATGAAVAAAAPAMPGTAAGPGAQAGVGPGSPAAPSGAESATAGAAAATGAAAPPMTTSAARVLTPAERVTADRPAVQRITAERAALEPETGVHRVWSRLREPRHPLLIAAGTLLIGAGIFLGSLQLLVDRDGGSTSEMGGVVPEEVEVAVLNGTAVPGLADNVSDDVQANGFTLGSIGNSRRKLDNTIVMFAEGQRRGALSVARTLGVGKKDVRPITNAAARGAAGADVVVVAGDDRVRL